MRLPRVDSSYEARVEFGAYVGARLEAAGLAELSTTVVEATKNVKSLGRALDDLEEPLQRAIALRDACDDLLDETAQTLRKKLAASSLDAEKKLPYTGIFPNGIGHYIAAPLDKQVARFQELQQRIGEHLDAADGIGKEALSIIVPRLQEWQGHETKVAEQRTAVAIARTRLEVAEEDWARIVNRVYGTLFADLGKKRAEQFFPRATRQRRGEAAGDDGVTTAEQ
jgi:hypothetical protein